MPILLVDAKSKTFTIHDAQSRSPITFKANNEIIDSLKEVKGIVKVNYEEQGSDLTAIGVTF